MRGMEPKPVISIEGAGPPLNEENLRQLHAASAAMRKIKRTVGIATFDGWSIATFSVLTWLCGMTDPWNILMGAGMGLIAAVELNGAKRLRKLDASAARMLAWNQLALAGLLIAYATWRIVAVVRYGAVSGLVEALGPEATDVIGPIDALARQISYVIYGGVIAIAILGQGWMAIYYSLRGRTVAAYLAGTPGWIVDMQRAGFGV